MIVADLGVLWSRQIPVRQMGGLAGMVEGLGILVLVCMTLTGGLFFLCQFEWGFQNVAGLFLSMHQYLSGFVWAYIIGHAGMAMLHWMLPIRFFKEMA